MTPTQKLVQIEAWSFSRLNDYQKCPALAKFKHVDKLREPDSPYGAKGTLVHEEAARYLQDKKLKLPISLQRFSEEFKQLRKQSVLCEQQWAFDKDWIPCSWFGHPAWLRIIMDAHYLKTVKEGRGLRRTAAVVIDYKTGKIYPDHAQQRSLYALGAMLMYSDAQEVAVQHWYLDQGEMAVASFTRNQFEYLKENWLMASDKMLRDTKFQPTPGKHCKWCHFRRSNSGPCTEG